MKSYNVITILIITLWACQGDDKIVRLYPDSGKKEIYTIDVDSLVHGEKLVYMDDTYLYERSQYSHGRLSGDRLIYFPSGNVEIHEHYKDDMLHDSLKVFYPNGALKIVMMYTQGTLNGIVTQYYEDGMKKEEVSFEDNEENGPFVEYHQNGQVKWKGTYLNGDNEFGLLEEFDDSGTLIKRMNCDSLAICKTIWTKEKGDIAS